ncbi:FtsX-like permease family protein [Candidatus Micrarchaeota archaeon]|nr:FtsX-like permease family protein [Candidatus Micrarchaeota archaeon]
MMNIQEAFLYSIKNLRTRSLRSWLTIIGMVVGVIAIVVILSISEGFNQDIRDQLSAFGADMMFVYPISSAGEGFGGGSFSLLQTSGKLFDEDVEDIQNIPGVERVARTVFGRVSLSYKDHNISTMIYPTDKEMFEIYGDYIEVQEGRLYRNGETRVAFFGYAAANELFRKKKVDVGSVIQINGINYRVVGIQEEIGTSLGGTDDANIYIPFEDGRELFEGQLLEDEVGVIFVEVDEGFNPENIKETIERKLAANHRVKMDDLDFSVITSDQIMEIVGTILFTAQLMLAVITLIASLVGAIGIANTMFMNVLERVKEIGILKSMGGTGNDILFLFLTESAIIGFTGGIIGLILGYAALEVLKDLFDVPVLITPSIIAFVFLFSVGTGLLAGYLPARRAAKMDPVEALGYE